MFTTNYKNVAHTANSLKKNAIGNSRCNLHLFPRSNPFNKSKTREMQLSFLRRGTLQPLFEKKQQVRPAAEAHCCSISATLCYNFHFHVQFKINENEGQPQWCASDSLNELFEIQFVNFSCCAEKGKPSTIRAEKKQENGKIL